MILNTIAKQKEKAQQAFASLEMPSFRYGQGLTVNLSDLDFEKVFAEIHKSKDNDLRIDADPNVKLCTLSKLDDNFIEQYAERLVPHTENKLSALHYAALKDVDVIIIPKNITITKPIFIQSKTIVTASAQSLIVVAEEGARVTIIEDATSTENSYYKSQVVQVYAHPHSEVTFCTIHRGSEQTYSFTTKRGEAKKDAKIIWLDFVIGNKFTQVHLRTNLIDAGAETKQYQAFLGNSKQKIDINSDAFHKHSHTNSLMLARGILSDESTAMYRGTIGIEKNSRGCNGHQKSEILLIGEKARCNSLPVLEVENEDVHCSHGSTMGQIDEEQLYYLTSRGLDADLAKQMIVSGFINPIIKNIPDQETQEKIVELIVNKNKNGTSN